MQQNIKGFSKMRIHIRSPTFFLLGVICLLILIFHKKHDENLSAYLQIKVKNTDKNINPDLTDSEVMPPTDKPYVYNWEPCKQNMSAQHIMNFSTLPAHIQDFLYYRHCRHFPMLLNVPDKCGGANRPSDVFLLLVIKSSPVNYDRREVLRKTWARERLQNGVWIRRIFTSGTRDTGFEKQRLNELLKLEHQEHNDILQWDFNDYEFNLTLKQILFLEWMERNCPHVRFLLNGDDDVFANTDNMVEYLQSLKDNNGDKHLFTGNMIPTSGPSRNKLSKYFVPVQVQESEYFPPYCRGGGYLLSGYTAMVIYSMSHFVKLFPMDDVYMGMCLEKAGLSPVLHTGVQTSGLYIPPKTQNQYLPCYLKEILLVHRFLPHQIHILWQRMHDPNLKCSFSKAVV